MRIMIHAAPQRMAYVEGYLVPELRRQGAKDITVWMDREGKGNLVSCLESFASLRAVPGGTWHLQDDALPAADFVRRAEAHDSGIVCGFCCRDFNHGRGCDKDGLQRAREMWYSFQCLRVPNGTAAAFADWAYSVREEPIYRDWWATGKRDDAFWRAFVQNRIPGVTVLNLAPNLVEHVDFLIGGSLINRGRAIAVLRSSRWEDKGELDSLKEWLRDRLPPGGKLSPQATDEGETAADPSSVAADAAPPSPEGKADLRGTSSTTACGGGPPSPKGEGKKRRRKR